MKKILVLGSSGLVGSRFAELYPRREELLTPPALELDITDVSALRLYFAAHSQIAAVVNFAAYTAVSRAEKQKGNKSGPCWQVNAVGPKNVFAATAGTAIYHVHVSTDLVFAGREDFPGPYPEDSPPEPEPERLTWYGQAKAEAEKLIPPDEALVRLIYPVRSHFVPKGDYLRTPLRLFRHGQLYPLFVDQQITLTFIDEAAAAIRRIINQRLTGVFHVSTPDTTTPYEIISYFLSRLGCDISLLQKSPVDESRYPKYGGLKVEQTQKRLGTRFSPWKEVVEELIKQGISDQPASTV